MFSLPVQVYVLFFWLNNTTKPKWMFRNAYPTSWMLLSFVMLHTHFVVCIAGAYWNNIITIDIERHALSTVKNWFIPKHHKPPYPIMHVVTMNLESLEGNCDDTSSNLFNYNVNQSITYSISQRNFTKSKSSLIDHGANGSITDSDIRVI